MQWQPHPCILDTFLGTIPQKKEPIFAHLSCKNVDTKFQLLQASFYCFHSNLFFPSQHLILVWSHPATTEWERRDSDTERIRPAPFYHYSLQSLTWGKEDVLIRKRVCRLAWQLTWLFNSWKWKGFNSWKWKGFLLLSERKNYYIYLMSMKSNEIWEDTFWDDSTLKEQWQKLMKLHPI